MHTKGSVFSLNEDKVHHSNDNKALSLLSQHSQENYESMEVWYAQNVDVIVLWYEISLVKALTLQYVKYANQAIEAVV
jgi:hypothetical protein